MKVIYSLVISFGIAAFCSQYLFAEDSNLSSSSLASGAVELAQSENQGNTIRSYLSRYSFGLINSEIDKTERKIESSTNFTHLNLNIGSDSLGLKNGSSALTELMAVYRLYETPNSFFFNQTSLSNFDGRNTCLLYTSPSPRDDR